MTQQRLHRWMAGGKLHVTRVALPLVLLVACHPITVQACTACYGKSDSPMAKGMNAGIFTLLAVVGVVLSIFSAFFVFLAKKAESVSAASAAASAADSSNHSEP